MSDNDKLTQALLQRGHKIKRSGTYRDILVPISLDEAIIESFENMLYNLMKRKPFREKLRDWAYSPEPSLEKFKRVNAYMNLAAIFDPSIIQISQESRQVKYAHTFEWFMAQMLVKEFGAKAAGFNIRLEDANPNDEFDCIALLDGGLAFIECKTGRGPIFPDVEYFIRRDKELSAAYSFFIFDRDYIFSHSNDDVPTLTVHRARTLGIDTIDRVTVSNSALQFYFFVCGDRCFLSGSLSNSLERSIRHMLRHTMLFDEGRGQQHLSAYRHTRVEFMQDGQDQPQ